MKITNDAPWRKSSYSGGAQTNCVEVAPVTGAVGIRDTKNREGGHLAVSPAAFRGLVALAKREA